MKHSSSSRLKRDNWPRLSDQARVSHGALARVLAIARFLAAAVPLLLTLFCWATPCAASEQEEQSPPMAEGSPEPEVQVDPGQKFDIAPPPRKIWYGWQNLIVDGAGQTLSALGLGAVLATSDGDGSSTAVGTFFSALLASSYALGGPIVHFSHKNVGKGFLSLGLRGALPWAGALVGYAIETGQCEPDEWFCGITGSSLGFLLGVTSAISIDAGVLAYKEVTPEDASKRSARLESLVVLPRLSPDGGGLSVGGSF